MPGRQPLFTFRLVPLVAGICEQNGVDPLPLVRAAGLGAEALREREVTAPLSCFRTLLASVGQALGDDAFGLTLAERVPEGTYSLLEFGARSAQTLREALLSLERFGPLVNAVTRFSFTEDPRGGRFGHSTLADRRGQGRELHEFTLARVLAIGRAQVGEDFFPLETWFSHPKPKSTQRLVRVFGKALRFSAKGDGFLVPARVLDLKLAGADLALKKWLDAQSAEALARMPGADDLTGRVRARLTSSLSSGGGEVKAVALAMKMSDRTLQRKLLAEGTTFAALLEEVRRALAERYLVDPRLTVSEVAWLLGYSELRAFDRAFLRWYQQTPSAWRAASTR